MTSRRSRFAGGLSIKKAVILLVGSEESNSKYSWVPNTRHPITGHIRKPFFLVSCNQASVNLVSKFTYFDNAIITSIRAKIINLETLNNQLITINGQITDLYNQMNSQVTVQTGTLSTNGDNLSTQYSLLMDEKIKIKNLLDEYNNIDNSNIDQTIVVDQQNSSYYLWLIICIISIILVIKFIAFPDSKGNLISVISWTSIFICITLATLHLNNPAAYAIWLILIVLVLMMKSELIPSI